MIINRIVLIVYSLTLFVLYNFSYLLYVVIGKGITPFHHCVFVQHVSFNISPRWYVFTILYSHFNGLVSFWLLERDMDTTKSELS